MPHSRQSLHADSLADPTHAFILSLYKPAPPTEQSSYVSLQQPPYPTKTFSFFFLARIHMSSHNFLTSPSLALFLSQLHATNPFSFSSQTLQFQDNINSPHSQLVILILSFHRFPTTIQFNQTPVLFTSFYRFINRNAASLCCSIS